MRIALWAAVAGLGASLALPAFAQNPELPSFEELPLPRVAPQLEVNDLAGEPWKDPELDDEGKTYLVEFWATWCTTCRAQKPWVQELRAELLEEDFEVLSVSIDQDRGALDEFVDDEDMPNPVLHDTNRSWAEWKVPGVPSYFVVEDGKIVKQWLGKVEKDAFQADVREVVR